MDDALKNLKHFIDKDGKRISLPVDDFEELLEQILDRPEIEKALKEADRGETIPWEEAVNQIGVEADKSCPTSD